ncbi:glycosyltransferase family 4 protein [Syntrophus gentianae]|nr:glycosyltransferase family 4 protein [Syntrophus gentianae]
MRIIYLHQYFTTPEKAGGTRSYEMARRLVAAGHEVHMVTTWREPIKKADWFDTVEAGIQVHWLPVPYSNYMNYNDRIRSFIRFAWSSAKKAASLPGDVVFATSTPLTIALPAVYAAHRKRIPMVFEVRDLWPEIPIVMKAIKGRIPIRLAYRLERFAYDHSAAVVALSPGMRDGVARRGYREKDIHIIPNSCDLDLFQVPKDAGENFRSKYEWLGDRPLVVYTGAFGRINGVSYFANLAAEIQDLAPEVRFLSVGDGYEYSLVESLAKKLGILNKNFVMMQAIPKNEIPALLSAATMATSFVINLPEMWSNSANKFFDALAAGRPIAINYGGWQADLIEKADSGIVLPPDDIPQAAKRLVNALNDKKWLDNARAASANLAKTQFDRNRLAKQLESVLAEVFKRKRIMKS